MCVGLSGCSVAMSQKSGMPAPRPVGTRILHHDLVAEGSERSPIEGHGPRVILYAKADVVEHGRDDNTSERKRGAGLPARRIVTIAPVPTLDRAA